MMKENAEFIIFVVEGGIGKVISSTAVARAIHKAYPDKKIVVVCGFPEIYKLNPNVCEAYNIGQTPKFYDTYIRDGKFAFFRVEPYLADDYIFKTGKHITEIWCNQLGVAYDGQKPDLFFSKKEQQNAENFVKGKNKPILMMQLEGGVPPDDKGNVPRMFVRNIPAETFKTVADKMKDKYRIFIAKAATQTIWVDPEVEAISYPLRLTLALIPYVDKLLLIDSMMQHAAAALDKKAVVLWCGTSPKLLGYDMHTNLTITDACPMPQCHRPNSYLFDRAVNNDTWECPYGEPCTLHKAEDILKVLNDTK